MARRLRIDRNREQRDLSQETLVEFLLMYFIVRHCHFIILFLISTSGPVYFFNVFKGVEH